MVENSRFGVPAMTIGEKLKFKNCYDVLQKKLKFK